MSRPIRLEGVEVHNLKSIDLELPTRQLIVLCGVSGSGKSSLAFDTLYAEGQRRYVETFSPYTRQFLERLEKPATQLIDGIPPAVAVVRQNPGRSSRATIGTMTETNDYLRLLLARIGEVVCPGCGRTLKADSPESAAGDLASLPDGARVQIGYQVAGIASPGQFWELATALREEGFVRAIWRGRTRDLTAHSAPDDAATDAHDRCTVIVDRLSAGAHSAHRLRDSLESAFARGEGHAVALVEGNVESDLPSESIEVDGQPWRQFKWSRRRICPNCEREYPDPDERLLNFNSPAGACPTCEGFGNIVDINLDAVVPDRSKSIRDGAIVPWNTPAYAHELEELLSLASDQDLRVDVPLAELTDREWAIVEHGVPERKFGGLDGFFAWLERRKYKMHIRVFLSRWRSYRTCPECKGARLRPEALAVRLGGLNLAEISALPVGEARRFFRELSLTPWQAIIGRSMREQVESRLRFLEEIGLEYLSLDRPLRTVSGGELQRVTMTSALGSSLVNLLYVLDEPSIGLHPRDTHRLIRALHSLRDRGNTVVVVEHEEDVLRAADQLIEIGPAAGERGGQLVFQGTPREILHAEGSLTGDYLSGRRQIRPPVRRRKPEHGWVRLVGARGHNLQNLTVEFPLGLLCAVCGVSGAGKSTLVEETLVPALLKRLGETPPASEPYDDVLGVGQIDDVVLVDQAPIGRSPRSNPVTYVKAFDEIRRVFAETLDARTHNYTAGHFSFNNEAGRCPQCEGEGYLEIDMQFMADVFVRCPQCQGARYRKEILEITHRGCTISDVLDMTAREAFTFFRGQTKLQARLKPMLDVGLDYLRLGQPANTLSGGEAQRLKLAAHLAGSKRRRVLFVLDEPTTGLHFADVVNLLDCFDALLATGNSILLIEHNLHVLQAADYLIELGPGPAEQGGRVIATGPPESLARNADSVTGRFLAPLLESLREQSA